MNKTGIEYLDYTWNPIAMRCTPISEACDNCWHLRTADRLKENPKISRRLRKSYAGFNPPTLVERKLFEPAKVKKPSIIGVQFMGDLFHEKVEYEYIRDVFHIMDTCRQHTYLILTKRPFSMKRFIENSRTELSTDYQHIWIGVTLESARHYDRIEILKSIPAAKHFVSFEPLLSAIDPLQSGCVSWGPCSGGGESGPVEYDGSANIDLAIVGAETGPKKRHMELAWARNIRDWCNAFGIPFFFKVDSDGNHELDGRVWEEMPERIK